MKFRFTSLLAIFLLMTVIGIHQSQAQLLKDINKLKSEKSRTKGFSLYKKKVVKRAPSGASNVDEKKVSPKYSQGGAAARQSTKKVAPKYSKRGKASKIRAITPRYSSNIAGRGSDRIVSPKYSKWKKAGKITNVNPKYSIDIAGKGSDKLVIPKYSRSLPGKGSDRVVSPKYSRDIAGKGSDRIVSPKYSQSIAGSGSDRIVRPKYSRDVAGQGYGRVGSPRYSVDIAGKGSDRVVNPRYSRFTAGQGNGKVVNPRYSREIAGQGYGGAVSPRYSRDIAGQGSDKLVIPRYSKYVAGQGMDRVVNPRFSVNPFYTYAYKLPATASGSMVFEFPKKLYQKNRKRNRNGESEWMGPEVAIVSHKRSEYAGYSGHYKHQKKGKHMHPSANYLYAKNTDSEFMRGMMQKASILWVRVHRNQTDPKGVKKKASKLKFDKDEAEIWNNKEREYSHEQNELESTGASAPVEGDQE